MATLHVYGIDHSRAAGELFGALALARKKLIETSLAARPACEVLLLSNSSRTEVYMVTEGNSGICPLEVLRRGQPKEVVRESSRLRFHRRGPEADTHLFTAVADSLSEVSGDTCIRYQLAGAASRARTVGMLGPVLEGLVAGALRVSNRVRRDAGRVAGEPGTGPAVLAALRQLGPTPQRHRRTVRVLLLGAGAIAADIANQLQGFPALLEDDLDALTSPRQVIRLAGVWARHLPNSIRFTANYGIPLFSQREAATSLATVDAVVATCRGQVPLLSEQFLGPILARRTNPLIVLDCFTPGALSPSLAMCDGVHPVFLHQSPAKREERTPTPPSLLENAERIVADEAARFLLQYQSLHWPLPPSRGGARRTGWRETPPIAAKTSAGGPATR